VSEVQIRSDWIVTEMQSFYTVILFGSLYIQN